MKHLVNLTEAAILLCVAILIVAPEIAYSLVLRARDKIDDMVKELKINFKKYYYFYK